MQMKRDIDNRGMSLVEMIIVVAIMAVILGIAGLGLGVISGKPAEKCAQKLTTGLQTCRTVTMGKYAATCYVYRDSVTQEIKLKQEIQKSSADGIEILNDEVVGEAGVTLKLIYSDGTQGYLDSATIATFGFNRGTGALEDKTGTGVYCTQLEVSKGNTTRTVKIVPLTGRITLE